jgi:DNA-binding NtrC family response regulator
MIVNTIKYYWLFNKMYKIIFIDRDKSQYELIKIIIPEEYYIQFLPIEKLDNLKHEHADIIMTVVSSFEENKLHKHFPPYELSLLPPLIGLAEKSDMALTLSLIKHGWFDFLIKPFTRKQIEKLLNNAIAHYETKNMIVKELEEKTPLKSLIGTSRIMEGVKKLIIKCAPQKSPVLILGESGTGKELVARNIHNLSDRSVNAFIARNCSAIPETIFDSEMQGAAKGAYTDAVSRPGCFELANRGTLFLDEIGEMPSSCQSKLLRILEDPEITRIGGTNPIKVDVRIIAASNRDLKQAVASKEFREDLFYRIGVLAIYIPPLRKRKNDIPQLVRYFLFNYDDVSISPEALEKILAHDWPGNVRELKNVIERSVVMCEDHYIKAKDIVFL